MKVITCFSYKGGSGRTVAASNLATSLASTRKIAAIKQPLSHRVAILDLDVFSAGTHRVFEVSNDDIERRNREGGLFLQDYLTEEIEPARLLEQGTLTLDDPTLRRFATGIAEGCCEEHFTLFPSRPGPDEQFVVAKYHENLLLELILELERVGFDYAVLDGESGTRSMADIALRLADVVLMFFRLTWQHVDGTLNFAKHSLASPGEQPAIYLIPTCVPLVAATDGIYQEDAPGLGLLRIQTETIPGAGLNELAEREARGVGYFWSRRQCIHESLVLKGSERVIVYDPTIGRDQAAADYYQIAKELSERHPA